jgi:hypothetical protein
VTVKINNTLNISLKKIIIEKILLNISRKKNI